MHEFSADAGMQAMSGPTPTIVVSIDGLATRAISPERTPTICSLVRDGAGCFTGSTVTPPITLPAHTSMLRSMSPATHGILGNEPLRFDHAAPSFLQAARDAGRSTSALLSWRPLSEVIEPTATTHRMLIDGGYHPDEDRLLVDAACDQLVRRQLDVTFVYLSGTDLAGHAYGWDDAGYHEAVIRADAMLGEIVAAAGDRSSILVTTDHGGSGTDHTTIDDDTMGIFVAARSPLIDAGGCWETFSPLDIAPTVAHLAGFERHPDLQAQLAQADPPMSAAWARDACRCRLCRDEQSGQHVIDPTELDGWHVVAHHRSAAELHVDLRHDDDRRHLAIIPDDTMPTEISPKLWGADHGKYLAETQIDAQGPLDEFVSDLAEFGIAVVDGVPPEPTSMPSGLRPESTGA